MTTVLVLSAIIAVLFLAERLGIARLTRKPSCQDWIRRHRLVHPNTLSILRFPMGILAAALWLLGWHEMAVIWFAVWMISDLTDGTIARNCQLVTERGKWLDPLSDKCLYFPPLLLFAYLGFLPLPWVVALVIIDTIGQFARLLITKTAANMFGKAKTALLTILLSVTALRDIGQLSVPPEGFLVLLTITCTVLAFLSFYCKVIPDSWYANSLTFANFVCGIGAIYYIVGQPRLFPGNQHVVAFMLVFLGQFFDLFDGRLARKYGSTIHGAFFDDIADGTSFGLAIGLLIADVGNLRPAAIVLAVLYVACVCYRLIRFLKTKDAVPPGIFEGMPAPAGALLAGSAILLFHELPLVAHTCVALACYLMVSRIRYRHFARRIWPELPNIFKVSGFVLVLLFVNSRLTGAKYYGTLEVITFTCGLAYALLGIDRVLSRISKSS
ncbi:MAG: CDP-alcohol phosphatidyltransferase family protein [Candidatus Pacebacteria bacterium]|nr:CDP-alcohol phosphatidyltransferase family protein [Candidatus Paceibacterota bacterium]